MVSGTLSYTVSLYVHVLCCGTQTVKFPVRVFSCRLGVIKPEPGIYRSCLEALKVPAASTLFLDDTPENVSAARALGMQAAVFRSPAETLVPLIRRHGLPPLPAPGA